MIERALMISGVLLAGVCAAQAAPKTPPCTLDGFDWRTDPIYLASLRPEEGERRAPELRCAFATDFDFTGGGAGYRLAMGEILEPVSSGDPIKLDLRIAAVFRRDGDALSLIGRFLVPKDPLDNSLDFAPQNADANGATLLRISPRNPSVYVVARDKVDAAPAFDWRLEAAKRLPATLAAGQALELDLAKMRGRIAVHRAGGDDPAHPGSAYDERRALVADLVFRNGALALVDARVEADAGDAFAGERRANDDVRREHADIGPGVEPCDLGGWSNDVDPHGLNVRAEPRASGRILGVVPPAYKFPGDDSYKSEFRIIGYRDGWFLIAGITPPGKDYVEKSYPRSAPQPWRGRGWVRATMVGAAYAFRELPPGRIYAAPSADAAFRIAKIKREGGGGVEIGDAPKALLACSGLWGLVDTGAGERGWVEGFCSNQVTNCS